MRNKNNICLETRPCVLEDEITEDYVVRPSASIYYGKFPYKIVFNNRLINESIPNNAGIDSFDHDLEFEFRDFASNFNNFYRMMFNSSRRIYFSDYNDLTSTLAMYGDWVEQVQGPISDNHIDLLYTDGLDLVVKTTPFYKKYDYKLEIYASYYAIRNLWLSAPSFNSSAPSGKNQWKNQMREDLENFVFTLKAQDFDSKINYGSFGSYHNAVVFFTEQDYQDILTFKKLTVPDFRTRITKVIT